MTNNVPLSMRDPHTLNDAEVGTLYVAGLKSPTARMFAVCDLPNRSVEEMRQEIISRQAQAEADEAIRAAQDRPRM